jgi:hypothetical protein
MNGEVSLIVRATTPGSAIIDTGFITSGANPSSTTLTIPDTFQPVIDLIGCEITIINGTNGCTSTVTITNAVPFVGAQTLLFFTGLTCTYSATANLHSYTITTPAAGTSVEYYLDLFENESISQNWRYTDLNNFTSLGAFSREFRVPYTDRNQLALGALFDVNYDGGINNYFHYKLPSEIRVDTLPIAKGYVRVRKVYQQQGKINEIELAFYAETPDLFKTIGENKLKDLTDLPNLNEVVKYDNVTITTPERVWSLIDRGQLWSEQGQAGTRRINNANTPVYAADLTPAVRWDYLLEQIIADAGFELEASSLLAILAGYHMPWINKSFLDTDDLGPQYAFRAYNASAITLDPNDFTFYTGLTEAFDNNNNFNPATGTYTAPGGGRFTFHLQYAMESTNYLGTATQTRLNLFYSINGQIPVFMFAYEYTNTLQIDFTIGLDLQGGDTVQFALRYVATANNGIDVGTATVRALYGNGDLGFGSLVELIGTQLNYGSTIIYNLNAPDMRQIDFLNDVIKMHNCTIVADRTNPNKISIVPYNSYVGSGNQLDWNAKLDISKDITIYSTTELQKNKTTFTYTAGEDYLSKLYKDNNRTYGEYKAEGYTVNPDVPISSFVTGDNTVQLITRSTPSGNIPGTDIPIPQFINTQNEFVVPGPRALFAVGSYVMQLYDDSVGVEAPVQWTFQSLQNYSNVQATITDFDLNFAPEVPPFQINANPYNNLFNLYWRNAMNELYSPNARIMEAYFALDLTDILTFQFNDIVYVNNAQWRILEVTDYKVGQFESTKVKLIKYIDSEADCSGTPESININGTVNFIDGAGDPVAATQSCCVRYGYEWSESDGECYAFNSQGGRPTNGITGTGTAPVPRNASTQALDGNSRSVQQGVVLSIAEGNNNTIAVGDTLKLTEAVRGNAMFGKNVLTKLPGLHVGGGWTLDNRTNGDGNHQYGTVILSAKDTLTAAGYNLLFTIEGRASTHIDLPNDTVWSCFITANVYNFDTNNYMSKLFHVFLRKIGATAGASAVTTLDTITSFGSLTLALNVDTTTNTAQHRMNLTAGGSGFPYNVRSTMTIQYTQIR